MKVVETVAGVLALCAALAYPAASFGESAWVQFKSSGVDTYDGSSPVMVGERYALVWLGEGLSSSDVGFDAKGALVRLPGGGAAPADEAELVAVHRTAAEGRCTTFQAMLAEADLARGGAYWLYLLDTRALGGAPSEAGYVYGYGPVGGGIPAAEVACGVSEGRSVRFDSAVPAGTLTPVVSAVSVDGEAGVARLTVTNTEAFIRYNVAKGGEPGAVDAGANAAVSARDGAEAPEAPVTLEVPLAGDEGRAFYRIIRNIESRPTDGENN